MPKVFVQNWEESERGWGVRPDGFTVHISRDQRDAYVDWYNQTFNDLPEAPDEYTRISGDPFEIELYNKIAKRSMKKVSMDGGKKKQADCVHGVAKSWHKNKLEEKDLTLS